MAELVLKLKGRELARVPIEHRIMTIGRDAGSDLRIDNDGISRLHATVRVVRDGCIVMDNDSKNGIFVNRKRVTSHRLADRDEIQIGKFSVVFLASSGPPLPLARELRQRIRETLLGIPTEELRKAPAPRGDVRRTVHMDKEELERAIEGGRIVLPPVLDRPTAVDAMPDRSRLRVIVLAAVLLIAAGVLIWLLATRG